ncbi:MAG TPA: methylated-DNA--[protein]-cysteine S-methyltransferase [Ilumatobacteraceae bacterium]|nr:methylated-DNA--[protein]-cysteine S-methyltransferase [Ilumatobacteraceae bacterium]
MVHTVTMDSPVGPLRLVASERGMRAILWGAEDVERVASINADELVEGTTPILEQAVSELEEYFDGTRREFDMPLDPVGTPFQQSAWMILRTIPYGQTISYGQQALQLGDPNKARAVGAANGKNPLSIVVPCHRVIGSTGHLTGFAAGLDVKSWLLDHERQPRLLLN